MPQPTTSLNTATNPNGKNDATKIDAAAVKQLAALAHQGRLILFKELVKAGTAGVGAGELARSAGIGATTASAQLLTLSNASLIKSTRSGRQVIYQANYPAIANLMRHLMEDCCQGRCEIFESLGDMDCFSTTPGEPT